MTWEPDYVTLAEAKAYLRLTDTDDDALIATWITTASRAVDTFCHRQFGKVDAPQTRTYTSVWDRYLGTGVVEIDDLANLTGLAVLDADGYVATGYEFGPTNALLKGRPYERMVLTGSGRVTVTGNWGWPAVPVPVKNATLLQVARFAARRDSPFGVAGSPSEGSETRLLSASLDPDLKTSLGSKYRREWWAA